MSEKLQEMINEGIAYIQANAYEEAEKVFLKVLEADRKCQEAYMHLGNIYVNMQKYDESIKAFKIALMLEPKNGLIYFNIGSVCFLKEDWLNAILNFNKAEENGLKTIELYLLRAVVFEKEEDYVQAIREVSKAIRLKPLKPELYVKKAHLQVKMGQAESAIETAETLKELLPDALEGYELGVWIYSNCGQLEKALALVEEGSKRFPKDSAFPLLKVDVWRSMEKYEEVNSLAEELISYDLDSKTKTQIAIYKAESCGHLGMLDEMKQILETYKDDDASGRIHYMLMMTYSGEKQYVKVKEIAKKLQGMDVDLHYVAAAKMCYAEAVSQNEGEEKAKEIYQSLVKEFRSLNIKHPEFYEVYIYRILCYVVLKKYEEAIEIADFLEKAYPEMADGNLYKYYIFSKMGREEEAREQKEKALAINPEMKVQW